MEVFKYDNYVTPGKRGDMYRAINNFFFVSIHLPFISDVGILLQLLTIILGIIIGPRERAILRVMVLVTLPIGRKVSVPLAAGAMDWKTNTDYYLIGLYFCNFDLSYNIFKWWHHYFKYHDHICYDYIHQYFLNSLQPVIYPNYVTVVPILYMSLIVHKITHYWIYHSHRNLKIQIQNFTKF